MTKRTWLKFARGMAFAAIGTALTFATDHLADLGLPPGAYAIAVPLVAYGYRTWRDLAGKAPA